METVKAKAKKWGNSLGIVLPKSVVEKENIKEDQEVSILIIRDNSAILKDTYGMLKGKLTQSAQEIKDELRRELYD